MQKGYHDIAFGKSGAGAPRRTSKGKVNTHIIADPETHVPNVYRANPNIDTYVHIQLSGEIMERWIDRYLYKMTADGISGIILRRKLLTPRLGGVC